MDETKRDIDNDATDQPDRQKDHDNSSQDQSNHGNDDTMLRSHSKRMKQQTETTVVTKPFSGRWVPPIVGIAKCEGNGPYRILIFVAIGSISLALCVGDFSWPPRRHPPNGGGAVRLRPPIWL